MILLLSLFALAEEPAPAPQPAPAPAPVPAQEAAPAAPPAPVAPPETPTRMRFQLLDGQVLEANARRSSAGWAVDVQGQLFLLPDSVVAQASPATGTTTAAATVTAGKPGTSTGYERADANRTRYFYAPTAFSLGSGNGYVSQKELLFTTAAIGVGDHLDLQVGTVIPTLFVEDGQVAVVGAKLSQPLGAKVHVGAGAQLFAFSEGVLAMPFVVGTVGTPDRHLSASVGSAIGSDSTQTFNIARLVNVSGAWRVREHLALLTENYVLLDGDPTDAYDEGVLLLMPSAGLRFLGDRFTTDVGFFTPLFPGESIDILLPWLDVTWNFGRPRAR